MTVFRQHYKQLILITFSSLVFVSGCSFYGKSSQKASVQPTASIETSAAASELVEGDDCTVLSQELLNPPTLLADGRDLSTALSAAKVNKCVNGKVVALQSYIDQRLGMDSRPVGPAYVLPVDPAKPNPQLNINFTNALVKPEDLKEHYNCGAHDQDAMSHGAAGHVMDDDVKLCTNLHTHGFHVSPKAPSDDVFLVIKPGDPAYPYAFDIPNYHPPGTHWLHAHLHGSTAPQVKNGMAGALILKGAIDEWLEGDYGITGDKEKIMIYQQLEDDSGNALCGDADDGSPITTSINGQCLPKITVQAGDVYHWRMIHAGVSATINMRLENVAGESVTLREYARDGITMQRAVDQELITLQPGYRSDVLLKVPQCPRNLYPCTLFLVDAESDAHRSLYGRAESRSVVAKMVITGFTQSEMRLPLANSPQFKSPYPFISDEELKKVNGEYVVQRIWFANEPTIPGDPGAPTLKTVNGFVFPEGPTETLTLGTATLWNIWVGAEQLSQVNHPFHIHVNPFQVTETDVYGHPFHYWKDTLLISGTYNKGEKNAVEVRSRYENFDGKFVLHCHNLNHEDAGMMKEVEIVR